MSQVVEDQLDLNTMGGGVTHEKFERELRAVLANIADPNTEAEAKRTITLTFTVKPEDDRERLNIVIEASSKLAPSKSFGAIAFLGRHEGEPVAVAFDPRQLKLPSGNATGVTPFRPQEAK